jgi:dolichyl-phosphate beta-glucosyltransferase
VILHAKTRWRGSLDSARTPRESVGTIATEHHLHRPDAGDMRIRIVVPCYNEAQRLDVGAFDRFLVTTTDVGFVFVNDGSKDDTLAVLRGIATRWPGRIDVIDQQPNAGKAEAVRVGMQTAFASGARYAGYFDADLATPLDAIEPFVDTLDRASNVDIVIGARLLLLGRHIERDAKRHYLGRIFATAASLVLDLPVYDTQCGAKLFRVNDVNRGLFETPFGSRWIFDVEIFARYLSGPGSRDALYELPLERWTDVGDSKVKSSDFVRAIAEMASIYRTYRLPRDARTALKFVTSPVVRYAAAGAVGTVIHFATVMASVELGHVPATVATAYGSLLGAVVNYVLNYYLTFASRASHARTLPRFFAVAAFGAGLNYAGMWLLVYSLHVYYLAAQLICTLLVLLVGYTLNKAWTFASSRRAVKVAERVVDSSLARAGAEPSAQDSPALATTESAEP